MKVVIVGGGAVGLSAAFLLRRAGCEVVLLEAAPQLGGLMRSFELECGAPLETFYHHFFTHDAEIAWLLQELNLVDRIQFQTASMGIHRDGQTFPFNGARDLLQFTPLGWFDRLRFGLTSLLLAKNRQLLEAEEIAALDWLTRRAGKSVTETIWRPLLEVKFGDTASSLPLAWLAGRLRQRLHSRRQGVEKLGYLSGSLQVLIDGLEASLRSSGVVICKETPVVSLLGDSSRVTGVVTGEGTIPADVTLLTLSQPLMPPLVRPLHEGYAQSLESIPTLGAICVVLEARRSLSPVYWLNVADAGYDFGGVIEQTHLVGPEHYSGRHLVYLSRYLDLGDDLWKLDDPSIAARMISQLEKLTGRSLANDIVKVHVFRARHAAPRVTLGFQQRIPRFRSPIPGLYLGCMTHVYPDERSVNNSIRIAAEVVRTLGFSTTADEVPLGSSLSGTYGDQTKR